MIIQPNAGLPRTEGERIIYDATPEQMATATSQLREAGVRIDTDLNPAAGDWAVPQKSVTALDRYGHVDEVAALVSFVAGPESSYITGANLTVDGGTNA